MAQSSVSFKSNFVLSGMRLVELSKVDRTGKQPLYFTRIACPNSFKSFQCLSFVDAPEIIKTYEGKTVSVELDPGQYDGRDTFTITNIIPE
jgi:hypothetical protein